VEYLYKRVDQDNSGSITYKEFLNFRKEFYFTVHADSVVEEVYEADKNHDDKLGIEEFAQLFKALKASLAKSNLGGVFFREHLTDLCTDMWQDENPEAGAPPIETPVRTIEANGSCWHMIGGAGAVAQDHKEDMAEEARQAKIDERIRKQGKMKNKHDDFNFARIFAARQAGYKGPMGAFRG